MNNSNLMRRNNNVNLLLYDLSNVIKDNYILIKNNANNIKKIIPNIMNNNIKICILHNLELIEISTEKFMEQVKLIYKKYDINSNGFKFKRNSSDDISEKKNKVQKFKVNNLNNSVCFVNPPINKKLFLQKKNSNKSNDFYNYNTKININTVNYIKQINKLKENNKNLIIKIRDKKRIIQNLFLLKDKYYKEISILKNKQNDTDISNFKNDKINQNSSQLVENLRNEIKNKDIEINNLSRKITNINSLNNINNCNNIPNISNNDLNFLLKTLKSEIEKFKNFSDNLSMSQNIVNNNTELVKNLLISNTIKFSIKKKKRKKIRKGKLSANIDDSNNSSDISSSSNKICLKNQKLNKSFSRRKSKCGIEKLNKKFKKIISQPNKCLNICNLEISDIFEKNDVELNDSCFKELKIMNSQDVNVNGDKLLKDEDFFKTYNSVEEELEANKNQLNFLKNDIKQLTKKIDLIKKNAKIYFDEIYITKKSREDAKNLLKSLDFNDIEINNIFEPKKINI